jgi:hypothetical protein
MSTQSMIAVQDYLTSDGLTHMFPIMGVLIENSAKQDVAFRSYWQAEETKNQQRKTLPTREAESPRILTGDIGHGGR